MQVKGAIAPNVSFFFYGNSILSPSVENPFLDSIFLFAGLV